MYDPTLITELIADNVRKTGNPFGVPGFLLNTWYGGEKLRKKGEWMLFTGMMYQFSPYIESTVGHLEKYEDSELALRAQKHPALAKYLRYKDFAPNVLGGAGLSLYVLLKAREEKRRADKTLKDIAGLLRLSGVDFGYDPDLDNYTGVLLYDLGDQDSFVRHARKVAKRLRKAGVKRLITVDPHTTYALKELYPKYTGISFEVRAYFELLELSGGNGGKKVTLHDPCFYGRYLEISDAPRNALSKLNVECVEVEDRQTFTHCCGGPAESISPGLSRQIMERRVEQLNATGAPIVAMCPVCLGNLKKSGADVRDLSSVLAECAMGKREREYRISNNEFRSAGGGRSFLDFETGSRRNRGNLET